MTDKTTLTPLPTPTAEDLVALQVYSPCCRLRGLVEREIARRVIAALLAAGHTITVDDGEDESVKRSTDPKEILEACFAVEDCRLHTHGVYGWVRFIMGNTGWDLIADYSINLEDVLKPASDYADQMCEWF